MNLSIPVTLRMLAFAGVYYIDPPHNAVMVSSSLFDSLPGEATIYRRHSCVYLTVRVKDGPDNTKWFNLCDPEDVGITDVANLPESPFTWM